MFRYRREVQALQAENNSLEKELHNYQVSIANKCGPPGASQPTTPVPRTWSSESTNMVNNIKKSNSNVEDGKKNLQTYHF